MRGERERERERERCCGCTYLSTGAKRELYRYTDMPRALACACTNANI